MKRLVICLVAALSLLAAAARTVPGEKVGVTFDEISYDFGNISADSQPVVHEFIVTNTGQDAVAILKATASCGCPRPQFDPKPLKPGKSTKIKVSFLPAGQKGFVKKDITVRLRSGKGKSEKVTLSLEGNVVPVSKLKD